MIKASLLHFDWLAEDIRTKAGRIDLPQFPSRDTRPNAPFASLKIYSNSLIRLKDA
jgi:hypothetical protein